MSRQYCQKCHKVISTCICQWLQVQSNRAPVLILQHSDEIKKTLGTARLVELSLEKAHVISGTVFKKKECLKRLSEFKATNPILLYAQKMEHGPFHITLDVSQTTICSNALNSRFDSIIVLDGTWRNTREILHKNEWLHTLPTISLSHVSPSRYRIRKSSQENALATIEAVAQLLAITDKALDQNTLLKPFEQMINTQIAKMGDAVYHRNYKSI